MLWEAPRRRKRQDEQRAIDPRNAFIIDTMLQREVVRSGTSALATQRLGRNDLAGKTSTTSDAFDGWFAGYAGNVVAVSWMGYDQPRSLGGREFGATLALPIWIDYMRQAHSPANPQRTPPPPGVSFVDGDWLYDEFKRCGVRDPGRGGVAAQNPSSTRYGRSRRLTQDKLPSRAGLRCRDRAKRRSRIRSARAYHRCRESA